MGNCTSKKSTKSLKISTGKRKIFSSKMDNNKDIHSNTITKKVVPFTKGEITSFGFKRKTSSHLPIPVTLTSHSNTYLDAKEKDSNSGTSQKNLSEGYQSGSSVESLCHAPFKSTPKMIRKKEITSSQQQVIPNAATTKQKLSHENSQLESSNSCTDCLGPAALTLVEKPVAGAVKNSSEAAANKFGFRKMTSVKSADLNGRTGLFPVSRMAFLTSQSHQDTGSSQSLLKKTDFLMRSRSEGPQASFKQSLKSSNSIQSGLNDSKSSLMNGVPRKFTLQTSHLPKPQYPVRVFDTKTAKTATNYYRRGGIRGESNISKGNSTNEDSGFESHSSVNSTLDKKIEILDSSPGSKVRRRLPTFKGKKLEMKVVGNKFELLKENEEQDFNVVTEISLIKLPPFPASRSGTSIINTGLVEERTNQYLKRISKPHENSKKEFDEAFRCPMNCSGSNSDKIKKSLSVSESEEEKLNSDSRKSEKFSTSDGCLEVDSLMLPGEAMADEESLCLSFEDDIERRVSEKRPERMMFTQDVIETPNTIRLDALKLSKELKYKTFSSFVEDATSRKAGAKSSVIVHLMKDEETFQCDNILESLSSDSDSHGDKGENKNNDKEKNLKVRKLNSGLEDLGIEMKELEDEEESQLSQYNNETDIEDDELEINVDKQEEEIRNNSLEARNSPNGLGTPSHTSNSLSLSDGRDFLIDDEIADQPQLCFSEKYVEIPVNEDGKTGAKAVDFKTSDEEANDGNVGIRQNADKIANGGSKEKINCACRGRNSEGTLSPCDSIASDDLMLDFESNSFEETAGRLNLTNDYGVVIGKTNDKNCNDVSSQIIVVRSDCDKLSKTGNVNVETKTISSPQKNFKIIGKEDFVKIDKVAYEDVFEDVISMKTMLLNLKRILSESEENLQDNSRLCPENGMFDNSLIEELADLRRQVLFLQQQLEEREKTVQILRLKMDKKMAECVYESRGSETRTHCNAATQTGCLHFFSALAPITNEIKMKYRVA